MKRTGRKEVSIINFEGVATDGGFIFEAEVFLPNIGGNWTETAFKATAYEGGVMEIAIDCAESIQRVAELVSGMFSNKSNFANLNSVILNYRNICLQVGKANGRKDIISMVMKAMSMPGYKDKDNDVSVDTQICQEKNPLRDSDIIQIEKYSNFFRFDYICKWGKSLLYRMPYTRNSILISSWKDGIVTVDCIAGNSISEFTAELKKFFIPYSNFYGVKAVEVKFNQFSIIVDEQNAGKILALYQRSLGIGSGLRERELQEYYNSPEYVRNHAKSLKANYRKQIVIQKVRQFQKKKDVDFTIVHKKEQEEWKNCKVKNSKDDYSKCIIDYTILWSQFMEYLVEKHGKRVAEVCDSSSNFADIYGITGSMYGCAVRMLSAVWKYGEELRVQHNAIYHY